jgi:SET domain-containing protein
VQQTADRGLGLFAARNIDKGTHVLVEEPMFAIDPGRFHADKGYAVGALQDAVEASFRRLNSTSREEYLACHEHRPTGSAGSRALHIFISNAYTMPDGRAGIFPRIAKINHSCRPNTVNTFSAARGARVIWAGRDIAAGEEITVTYVPLIEATAGRRARLAQYGFKCECEACHAQKGDAERLEMSNLAQELNGALSDPASSRSVMAKAKRLVRLVEDEGLVEYHAMAYRLATLAAMRDGSNIVAERWARKEAEMHEFAR